MYKRQEQGDVLVLSGSIPSSISDTIYEEIMERLDGRGIRIVVDATKELLLNVLQYHPFQMCIRDSVWRPPYMWIPGRLTKYCLLQI